MRGGILIIGSLLWEVGRGRDKWREERLQIGGAIPMKVPIRYGRCSSSRANTYTMTFSTDSPLGRGVLVPLKATFANFGALLAEAESLWKAEQPSAAAESIGAEWGCVGVMFRPQSALVDWQYQWADHFHDRASSIRPVDTDGILRIPWPARADDGTPANVDIILATATEATAPPPDIKDVANAWCKQKKGHEQYFFKNVQYEIRTAEDNSIFGIIQEKNPSWLTEDAYPEAIEILRK